MGKGKSIHLLRGLGWCPLMQLPRGADVRSGGQEAQGPHVLMLSRAEWAENFCRVLLHSALWLCHEILFHFTDENNDTGKKAQ